MLFLSEAVSRLVIVKFSSACDLILVLKTVNRKPIYRQKETDPVTFRFLVTKTNFAT